MENEIPIEERIGTLLYQSEKGDAFKTREGSIAIYQFEECEGIHVCSVGDNEYYYLDDGLYFDPFFPRDSEVSIDILERIPTIKN